MDIKREKMVISETMGDLVCFFIAFSELTGLYTARGRGERRFAHPFFRTGCAMGQESGIPDFAQLSV